MKIVLFIIGVLAGIVPGTMFGAFAMHFLYSPIFGETPINFLTIYFPKTDTKIYTVARVWGITGNHEEVRLCSEPFAFGERNQAEECAVFHTERIFYKKDGPTSLQVYAPRWAIPPETKSFIGDIRICVNELKDFDEFKNFEKNFEEYGLDTISAP
jgi:hypothetical protein